MAYPLTAAAHTGSSEAGFSDGFDGSAVGVDCVGFSQTAPESWPISHSASLRANIPETSLVPLINEQGEKKKGRRGGKFFWCFFFPWGLGGRGRERRRAKRAAAQCSDSQSGR